MSNDTAAAIRAVRGDWLAAHRAAYLRSGGIEGHISDLTSIGGHPLTTQCLIRYRGRKSGRIMITPLIYGDIGGEVVIVGSRGGADIHPAWYHNIAASPDLAFQIAAQAWRASWREPAGAERQKIWDFMVEIYPPYAAYKAATTRVIPLVMMKPIVAVPVFTEAEVN